jgi:hypothetical protein
MLGADDAPNRTTHAHEAMGECDDLTGTGPAHLSDEDVPLAGWRIVPLVLGAGMVGGAAWSVERSQRS